jgi:hypothetical protein
VKLRIPRHVQPPYCWRIIGPTCHWLCEAAPFVRAATSLGPLLILKGTVPWPGPLWMVTAGKFTSFMWDPGIECSTMLLAAQRTL